MLTPKEIVAELVSEYGSLEAAMFGSETDGICRNCGNIQSGVEPNTRMYRCENCGEDKVYGIEETIRSYSKNQKKARKSAKES